jgi:hypothetical protein
MEFSVPGGNMHEVAQSENMYFESQAVGDVGGVLVE